MAIIIYTSMVIIFCTEFIELMYIRIRELKFEGLEGLEGRKNHIL